LKYPEGKFDWNDEDGTLLVLEEAISSCLVFLLEVAPAHLLAAARFLLRTSPKTLLQEIPLYSTLGYILNFLTYGCLAKIGFQLQGAPASF